MILEKTAAIGDSRSFPPSFFKALGGLLLSQSPLHLDSTLGNLLPKNGQKCHSDCKLHLFQDIEYLCYLVEKLIDPAKNFLSIFCPEMQGGVIVGLEVLCFTALLDMTDPILFYFKVKALSWGYVFLRSFVCV